MCPYQRGALTSEGVMCMLASIQLGPEDVPLREISHFTSSGPNSIEAFYKMVSVQSIQTYDHVKTRVLCTISTILH